MKVQPGTWLVTIHDCIANVQPYSSSWKSGDQYRLPKCPVPVSLFDINWDAYIRSYMQLSVCGFKQVPRGIIQYLYYEFDFSYVWLFRQFLDTDCTKIHHLYNLYSISIKKPISVLTKNFIYSLSTYFTSLWLHPAREWLGAHPTCRTFCQRQWHRDHFSCQLSPRQQIAVP